VLNFRDHRDRTRTILPHRAHRKKMIVRRHALQNRLPRRRHKIVHLPPRLRSLAPKDLKPSPFGIVFRRPRYLRIRSNRTPHICHRTPPRVHFCDFGDAFGALGETVRVYDHGVRRRRPPSRRTGFSKCCGSQRVSTRDRSCVDRATATFRR